MSVSERLENDFKKALKSGDRGKLSIIRIIKAAVQNREIEKGASLEDEDIYGILMSLVRQGEDSREQFLRGGRHDLAEKEARELSVIQSYLPQQLTEEEIKKLIRAVIQDVQPAGPKDMGGVMKSVMSKVKGRADGRLVSELVKSALNPK